MNDLARSLKSNGRLAILFLFLSSTTYSAVDGSNKCLALRGNGNLVMAHFGGMARLVEDYGVFDGGAGGSSATLSLFVYESMLMNPAVCGDLNVCDRERAQARLALLLKSVVGFTEYLANSKPIVAIQTLLQLKEKLLRSGAFDLADVKAGRDAVIEILRADPKILDLLDPGLIPFLTEVNPTENVFLLAYRLLSVKKAFERFGSFEAKDLLYLLGPKILNTDEAARRLSSIGDFYAARWEDRGGFDQFLTQCADATRGKTWKEISQNQDVSLSQCHAQFRSLLDAFQAAPTISSPRWRDPIGKGLPIFVSTSVVHGDVIDEEGNTLNVVTFIDEQMRRYAEGQLISWPLTFSKNLSFGYLGSEVAISLQDAKSRLYFPLNEKVLGRQNFHWGEALRLSPAEPGLSPLQRIRTADQSVALMSAGGWTDLEPALILKQAGCEEIAIVSHERLLTPFAMQVADLFHLKNEVDLRLNLYDTTNPHSAISQSYEIAGAVSCGVWDKFNGMTDFSDFFDHVYHAPIEAKSAVFLTPETSADEQAPNAGKPLRRNPDKFRCKGGVVF